MLSPIPEEHAFREDTGGGVLGFFSEEELILAGLDASNDSVTAAHPCDAEIIAGPAQCEQEEQTWSFPLRHQGRCRAPTATDKLKAKHGPSGSFAYSYAGQGRGHRDTPCPKPRVRNPATRKLHPRKVLQQDDNTTTMEETWCFPCDEHGAAMPVICCALVAVVVGPLLAQCELQGVWQLTLLRYIGTAAALAIATYRYTGRGRGRRDPPCPKPRARNPAKRKLQPRTVLQQGDSASTLEDYANDVPKTLQVIVIASVITDTRQKIHMSGENSD